MRRDWSGGDGRGGGARAAWWESSKGCCAEVAGTRAALGPKVLIQYLLTNVHLFSVKGPLPKGN